MMSRNKPSGPLVFVLAMDQTCCVDGKEEVGAFYRGEWKASYPNLCCSGWMWSDQEAPGRFQLARPRLFAFTSFQPRQALFLCTGYTVRLKPLGHFQH